MRNGLSEPVRALRRWTLLTERLDAVGHDASLATLVGCLEANRESKPHLGDFLDRWRVSTRPAPMMVSGLGDPARSVECRETVAA